MDQLNKLIKQYERENPGQKAKDSYYCLSTDKDIEFYTDDFVLWLASRPTCGEEQRLFLDEVEKTYVCLNEENLVRPKESGFDSRIWQNETKADLQKVIRGE